MKKLSVVVIFALSLVTCSKKDDAVPAMLKPPCLVTKITSISTLSNSSLNKTETFEYGADNKLAKVTIQPSNGSPTEVTYTYTNNIITKATYVYNTFNYVAQWTVANGNLVKIVTPGPPAGGVVNFTYESNTRLKTRNYKRDAGDEELDYVVTYGGGGNPASYQSSNVGLQTKVVDSYSTFDDKTNPYSLLAASMGLTTYLASLNGDVIPEALGKNNALAFKESYYGSGSSTPSSEDNITYVYNYNSQGNVTSYVMTTKYYSVNVSFEYKNCN